MAKTSIVSETIHDFTDERELYLVNPLTRQGEDGELLTEDEIQTLMGDEFRDEACPEGEDREDLKGLSIRNAKTTRERMRLGFVSETIEPEHITTIRNSKGNPVESPTELFGFHVIGRDVVSIDKQEHFIPPDSGRAESFVMLDAEERKQISPDTAIRVGNVTKIRGACANAMRKES